MKRLIVIIGILLLAIPCLAQGADKDVSVQATVDRSEIAPGESLTLTVEIKGGDGDVNPSGIRDFDVTSRGSASNISIINGDTAAVPKKSDVLSRKQLIAQFEEKPGFNILIMSPVAAGVGLTVVGANHVIHLERHWNPAKEAQASDRAYRIGQQRDVFIYLPALLHPEFDSFDVHLDRLLRGKIDLKDAVVTTDVVSEKEMASSMGLAD